MLEKQEYQYEEHKKKGGKRGKRASPVYKTVQVLGRAVAPSKALTTSITQATPCCLSQKLTEGVKTQHTTPSNANITQKPLPHINLPGGTIRTVIEFYKQDDISCQAPGTKGVAVPGSDGTNRKMSPYLLKVWNVHNINLK